jgi:hypothetical protein
VAKRRQGRPRRRDGAHRHRDHLDDLALGSGRSRSRLRRRGHEAVHPGGDSLRRPRRASLARAGRQPAARPWPLAGGSTPPCGRGEAGAAGRAWRAAGTCPRSSGAPGRSRRTCSGS